MTTKEVIDQIIIIYNIKVDDSNSMTKLKMLGVWLNEKFDDDERGKVFYKVLETFVGTQLNPAPFIPDFVKNIENSFENERSGLEAYELLTRKSNIYRDVVIESPFIQAGLDAIGGWGMFCKREIKDEQWTRKNFIKAYSDAMKERIKCDPKRYYGIGTSGKTILIGNEEKLKLISDDRKSINSVLIFKSQFPDYEKENYADKTTIDY